MAGIHDLPCHSTPFIFHKYMHASEDIKKTTYWLMWIDKEILTAEIFN